jgi:cytochrome c oxidase subunit 2
VTVVGALVLVGSIARRARPSDGRLATVPLERSGRGLGLIYVGTAVSFVVLLGTAVWGYVVLAQIAGPRGATVAEIRVTGHQWWWEVEYRSPEPSRNFTTANEIHIPVGQPVRIELVAADVIHSFWVPALSGKMDLIPSQRNETWIQADLPGVYRGQCAEYCGQQHAHMAFMVVAQPPDDFEAWWQHELQPPELAPTDAAFPGIARGQTAFARHCAVCHAIRGTLAQGRIGPNLSHLMQRRTIAAGTLPNTIGYLSGWISNPQHIKPGNRMPTLTLSAQELDDLRAYLQTLR